LPTFFDGSAWVSVSPPNKRFNQAKKPPLLSALVSGLPSSGLEAWAVSALGKEAGAGASGNTPLMTGV
jgi:hypothetical protein